MSDMDFEQMLAKYNQDFKESVSYNDLKPDDGKYLVSLLKFETGSKEGVPWWKLTGRVEDPQDVKWGGHEFTVGFYGPKTFGQMKDTAKVLAGRAVSDLRDALEILTASPGKITTCKVETTTSRKNGKEYTNCYIQEVIDEVTSADAQQGGEVTDAADLANYDSDIPFGDGPESVGDTKPTEKVG
jgi:hypothetical protein